MKNTSGASRLKAFAPLEQSFTENQLFINPIFNQFPVAAGALGAGLARQLGRGECGLVPPGRGRGARVGAAGAGNEPPPRDGRRFHVEARKITDVFTETLELWLVTAAVKWGAGLSGPHLHLTFAAWGWVAAVAILFSSRHRDLWQAGTRTEFWNRFLQRFGFGTVFSGAFAFLSPVPALVVNVLVHGSVQLAAAVGRSFDVPVFNEVLFLSQPGDKAPVDQIRRRLDRRLDDENHKHHASSMRIARIIYSLDPQRHEFPRFLEVRRGERPGKRSTIFSASEVQGFLRVLRDAPEKLYAALPLDGSFPFPFSREEDRVFLRSLLVERKYANISTIESTQVELENFFRFFKQDIHFRWQSLKLMLAFIVGQKRYDLEKGLSPGENPTPDSSEGVSADLVKACLNLFSPSPVQIKKDEREKYSKLIRSLAGLFTTDFLYAMPTVDKLEAVAGVKKREYDGAIRGLMAVVDGLERAPLDEDVAKAAMACAEGLRKNGMTLNGFRKIMLETEISKRSPISGLRREADALRMSGAHFYSLAAFYMELAEQLVVLSTDEKQLIHAMVLTGDEKPEEAMRALKGELPEPDQGLLKDVCRYFSSPTCQSGRSVSEKIESVRGKLSDNISVHDFANPSGALGPRYLGRTHTSAANTFQRRASLRVLGVLGNLNLTERRYLAAMAHLVENSQSPGDTSKTAAGIFLSQAPPVMDYTTMAQRCVALFQTNKSQYQTLQKFLVRALAVASRPGKAVEKDFHFNFYSAARAFEDDEKNKDLLEAVAALDEFETGDGLGEFLAFGELLEKPEVNQVPAGTASESARRLAFGPSFVGYYERFSQGRHPDPRTAATANREQFWKDFDVFINGLLSPTSRLPEAVAAFEDFVQFLVTMSEAENVNRFPVLTKIPGTEALRLLNPASPPALVLLYRLLQKEYSSCVPHYLRPGMVGFKIDGAERVVAAAKKILDFYKTILEGHLLTELRNLLESLDGGKKYDEDTVNRAHKLLNRIGKSVKSEPLALALNYIELSDKYSKHPETPTHPWSELGSSVELPAAEPPSSFETNTDMTTYEGDEPPSANS